MVSCSYCRQVVECKASMLVVAGSILGRVKIFLVKIVKKPFSIFKGVKSQSKIRRCAQV